MALNKPTGDMLNAGSNATPAALGTASAGTSTSYSRGDHVHAKPSASDIGALGATEAMGGDLSGNMPTPTVAKISGQLLAGTAPISGQVLTWNGSAWAPATASTGGGGGANGLTYYLREDVAADSPTTNLPGTPKQLGRTGSASATSITTGALTTGVWTLVGGYVSESTPIDPDVTSIPAGLWDFNVWAYGDANSNAGTVIRARVYIYDGTNAPTLIGTSGEQVINSVSAQFSLSVLVPQTTVTLSDRIYVAIEAKAAASNHTVTLDFGDGTPSHVHTSLPLVGGTGLWKSVAGSLQSPASLLVDADVDAAAAIAQSKISGLTTSLAAKADKTTTITAGTGLTGGGDLSANRTLAVSYGTTSTTACVGNDSRLADSRTPTGSASGDLTGTYPAPTLAAITTAQTNVGSSTQIPVLSVDAKGRVTALSSVAADSVVPGTYIEFFEHFLATTPLDGNLAFGSTGGTNATQNSGYGVIAMSTGAVASINQQARLVQAGTSALIGNASARVIFRAGQSGAGWFDATLTGAARFGWGDSVTADSANGIYFRVQNGQGIDFVTKSSNVETLTSTGVSFASNVFRSMEILINAAGTQVIAKIDGVTVATHTTNIPTARVNLFAHINRTAATATSVAMNIDFLYSRVTPNTPYF